MADGLTRRGFLRSASGGLAGAALLGTSGCASGASGDSTTFRLSHQWPQATTQKGDFRAMIARRFAKRVQERTGGDLGIRIYPNSSLVDSEEQYKAIILNALDASVYPLDYASGEVPQFSITLMPALVKSHAQARNWRDAEIGRRIDQLAQEKGIKILTWIWNAGGIGVRRGPPVVSPDDVDPGAVARAAGPWVERMLGRVGYSITSMSSSEIYSAMQTGVLDVGVTSASSFCSYRIYEQTSSYTSPTANTFWFMFEPLIIGKSQFDSLPAATRTVVEEVGHELQDFAYEASAKDDAQCEREFEQAGVQVAHMDDEAFAAWQEVSKPIWDRFAAEVEGGRELINLALQVPEA